MSRVQRQPQQQQPQQQMGDDPAQQTRAAPPQQRTGAPQAQRQSGAPLKQLQPQSQQQQQRSRPIPSPQRQPRAPAGSTPGRLVNHTVPRPSASPAPSSSAADEREYSADAMDDEPAHFDDERAEAALQHHAQYDAEEQVQDEDDDAAAGFHQHRPLQQQPAPQPLRASPVHKQPPRGSPVTPAAAAARYSTAGADDEDDAEADARVANGMATVPSTPPPATDGASVHAAPKRKLLDAGLAAMKKQLLPGILLQCVALLIIIIYYSSSSARESFDKLAEVKEKAGYAFSGISTCIFGGVIPTLIVFAKKEWQRRKEQKNAALVQGLDLSSPSVQGGHEAAAATLAARDAQIVVGIADAGEPLHVEAPFPPLVESETASAVVHPDGALTVTQSGPSPRGEFAFQVVFWFLKGMEVDAFYRLQGWMWGNDSQFSTIVCKVAFDQFIYNPPWAAPSCLLSYMWKDSNFNFGLVWRSLTSKQFWSWDIPQLLLSGWMVWIPACSMIYLLPASLQIPLFNIVLCFWSLVLALVAKGNK